MRVVILKEGETFVGQCLEHDICAQGGTVDEMLDRLAKTVELEESERGGALGDIEAAPDDYHKMWAASRRFADQQDGYELALAS